MGYFSLPITTKVNKVVPKNAFDNYTNTKQKKAFTERIARITWTNKLSKETTNLISKEITEIQIFLIELKVKEDIQVVLDIIDKSIPYPIIFSVKFGEEFYFSTSTKHSHPVNEDNAVIDWTFRTNWINKDNHGFTINLKKDLDSVYKDFCVQLTGKSSLDKNSLIKIVDYQRQVDLLEKNILKLKLSIKKTKQFNRKVELNDELNKNKRELKRLNDNS